MTNYEISLTQKIREQYVPHEETKLQALKRIDKNVKKGAKIFSYVFGSLSSLVLGTGMCLAMGVIGSGVPLMVAGIGIGIVGIGLTLATYPIYRKMIESSKKKHANEIIALSDEILNNK